MRKTYVVRNGQLVNKPAARVLDQYNLAKADFVGMWATIFLCTLLVSGVAAAIIGG